MFLTKQSILVIYSTRQVVCIYYFNVIREEFCLVTYVRYCADPLSGQGQSDDEYVGKIR